MTISSISAASSNAFTGEVGSSDGSFTSIAGEIAVLMLETEENQKQNEREQLSIAREQFSEALHDEVAALREQADASFRGAALQAGLSLAGAGASLWGVGRETEHTWQQELGAGLEHLAAPLGSAFGKTYGAADAKSAEGVETAAKWQLDDARKDLDDANGAQAKALDWLGSMVDRDAATMSAILSNKV